VSGPLRFRVEGEPRIEALVERIVVDEVLVDHGAFWIGDPEMLAASMGVARENGNAVATRYHVRGAIRLARKRSLSGRNVVTGRYVHRYELSAQIVGVVEVDARMQGCVHLSQIECVRIEQQDTLKWDLPVHTGLRRDVLLRALRVGELRGQPFRKLGFHGVLARRHTARTAGQCCCGLSGTHPLTAIGRPARVRARARQNDLRSSRIHDQHPGGAHTRIVITQALSI
jgi:hypothetical protein